MKRRCECTVSGTYTSGETDDFLNTDVPESGSDNIRWETEDWRKRSDINMSHLEKYRNLGTLLTSLGDLVNTRVLVVKSSDEGNRFTAEVDLEMDRTLGEDVKVTAEMRVKDIS